jgi:hypothetical protein
VRSGGRLTAATPHEPRSYPTVPLAAGVRFAPMERTERCEGCGEEVRLSLDHGQPLKLGEPSGRVSYIVGGLTVHQCAEGTYGPR